MSFRIGAMVVIGMVSSVLQSQPLSLGVKAGVPFTDAVEGSFGVHSEERPFTIGPTVEIRLPLSFAAEISGLYKRTGYSTDGSVFGLTSLTRVRANSWELPVLLKRYFSGHGLPARPFVEGGYVLSGVFDVGGVVSQFGQDIIGAPVNTRYSLYAGFLTHDNPKHGIAAGAGARLGAGRLHLSPEVRYTRWTGRSFEEQGSRGFFVQSIKNQTQFLLGLTF